MARTLEHFEDILEPRRREISNCSWALRGLNTISPCTHNKKYSPEKMKLEVLKSPKISNLIEKICQKNVPKQLVLKKIEEILYEIGYGRKLWVIRCLGYVLTLITTRVCRGIFVNKESIKNLKYQMGDIPIVYVPSHRSYADFILMSYLLFYYDIEIPAIAAGMDFHEMKVMGSVLRNTGAFFMRRSYTSDNLYWDTFREYVHQLILKGDKGIEFFVEGTRSRTGKSLYPKFGLLTMILRAFFNSEIPDIFFVPVNLTHDRVMEEKLFAFELLGVPKPKESTSGFFKSLSIVREDFGNVYVNFGEGISAYDFFNKKIDRSSHSLNSVHSQSPTEAERKATALLAQKIIKSQQKLCVVTTFNLIATVFNSYLIDAQKSVNVKILLDHVKWLDGILKNLGALSDFNGTIEKLLESLKTHNNLIRSTGNGEVYLNRDAIVLGNMDKKKLKGYGLNEATMTKSVPLVTLQLYVNPILHYFVNLALVVLLLRQFNEREIGKLFEEFNFLRSIFAREFVLFAENSTRDFDETIQTLTRLNVVSAEGDILKLNENDSFQNFLFGILEPFFHTYYIVCCILLNVKTDVQEFKMLSETQRQIEKLLETDEFIHPYSLSLDTITNCLQSLLDLKIIRKINREGIVCYEGSPDLVNDVKNRISDCLLHLPRGVACHLFSKF